MRRKPNTAHPSLHIPRYYSPDGMHFWSANSRLALGEMLVQNPQSRDEGTRLIDQGVSLREETLGHDNPHTIEARQLQAKVHSTP